MKNNLTNFKKELLISVILIILLILILNPYHLWMPNVMYMAILASTVVVFGIFASFILHEQVRDEREGIHRMLAGRVAFLSGSTTLIVGIIFQVSRDSVDPWLVLTLVIMILAKIATLLYSETYL